LREKELLPNEISGICITKTEASKASKDEKKKQKRAQDGEGNSNNGKKSS
jgi:hypothetical protein